MRDVICVTSLTITPDAAIWRNSSDEILSENLKK